jgi:electron-transferring-flavoprotein dehydrogenase
MKTGMLAAEQAFDALAAGDVSAAGLAGYEEKVRRHPMMQDLWQDRNFRHAFRHGLYGGLVLSQAYAMLGGGPRQRPPVEPDWRAWKPASRFKNRPAPARGPLILDKLTDVDRSRTEHREDQPSHIRVLDQDVCRQTCMPTYGHPPCTHFCPAQVYELQQVDGQPSIQVNFSNCVHCKTCVIVDPCKVGDEDNIQNIEWRAPAEGGPRYQIL